MEPIDLLRSTHLFSKLNADQLASLAALMKPEHHAPLDQLVHQGDLGNRFFVLASGTVNIRQTTAEGAERSVGALAAHTPDPSHKAARLQNHFGEQMFSSQEPYEYHVDAVTAVDVYRIDRSDFVALAQAKPQILEALQFVKHAEHKRTRGLKWIAEGEIVGARVSKHWWALAQRIWPYIVVLPLFLLVSRLLRFFSASQYEVIVVGGGLMLVLLLAGLEIYDWSNDEYVVTNVRVMHIERVYVFRKELTDTAPIDRIQGVVIERAGLGGILFGVGNLIIQTPGRKEGNVNFDAVGKPENLRAVILRQQRGNSARQAADAREKFRETVRKELRHHLSPDLVPITAPPVLQPVTKKRQRLGFADPLLHALHTPLQLELHFQDRVVWRKHWVVLLRQSLRWLGLLAVIVGIYSAVTLVSGYNSGCLSIGLLLAAACLGGLVYEWLDWTNDIYAVTDVEVIDSERTPFGLKEKTTIAPLDRISDIVVDVPSIWGTLLNYGTLKIDTAGVTGQIIFHTITRPREAQEEIYRRITEGKARRSRDDASIKSASVVDAIIGYHRWQEDKKREDMSQNLPTNSELGNAKDETLRDWKMDESTRDSDSPA